MGGCGTDTVEFEPRCIEILPPGDTCTAFCNRVISDCDQIPNLGREACIQICECDLLEAAEESEACAEATDAVFSCVSGLDCLGVSDFFEQTPSDSFPCIEEVEQSNVACPQPVDP